MGRRIPSVLLLFLAWCATAAAGPIADLRDYQAVDLPEPAARGEIRLAVEAFEQRWELTLRDHRAPFARLEPDRRAGIASGGARFLTGEIAGLPDSWVRLNWIGGKWWGGFHDGDTLYLIDETGGFRWQSRERPAGDRTLLFRLEDLDLSRIVGHDPIEPTARWLPRSNSVPAGSAAAQSMPLTIVTDTAFQTEHASDAAAIVAGRINFVDGIYSSQLGIGIVLDHLEPLTDDGPMTPTDAQELLYAFRDFMSGGDGSDLPLNGLGHLFTSRSRDGGTAGIAYLGVLCSGYYGFGVDWDTGSETTTSLVLAHELGHNFNAPHDGSGACEDETFRGIMNPSINGSDQFSACSLAQMQAEADSASCLVATPDAGLIFSDGFRLPSS